MSTLTPTAPPPPSFDEIAAFPLRRGPRPDDRDFDRWLGFHHETARSDAGPGRFRRFDRGPAVGRSA